MKLIPDRLNTRKINLFVAAILGVFILVAYGAMLISSPLPMRIIDSDDSGMISFGEAIDASDVGVRQSRTNPECTEYYWFKDGRTAFEECSGV